MAWSEQALSYFAGRAIDPELAEELGVRENGNGLEFPYPCVEHEQFARTRSLNGAEPKVRQPKGTSLCAWRPTGHNGALVEALVCEGESDALAAVTALRGSPVAHIESLPVVAVPGTGFPVHRRVAFLIAAKVEHAWLAFDADDAGRKYAEKLAAELEESGTRIRVSVVGLPDGTDLADCLAAVAEGERGDWIANLLVDSEHAALEEEPVPPAVSKSTLLDFSQIVARPVRWSWHHRVALAKITALAGRPKIGKGLLYSHLIASVTLGQLDGDLDGLTPHSLRRTFASVLYAIGEAAPVVMAEMGHTHPGLALRIYAAAMRRDDDENDRLRALVEGAGPTPVPEPSGWGVNALGS